MSEDQLASIIMAVHRVTQLVLSLLVVGTGLPQLAALAGNAKSYAERLFDYPTVGALSETKRLKQSACPRKMATLISRMQRLHDSLT